MAANMVSVQFGSFPPTETQDGVIPVPLATIEITNLLPPREQAAGLVPLTTSRGEVMWVHPDLVSEVTPPIPSPTNKKSGKIRTCHTISADNEEATAVVTWSGAQSQPVVDNPAENHQPTTTDAPGPAQPSTTDKPRPTETRFDKSL